MTAPIFIHLKLTCVTTSTESMYSSRSASHVPSFTLCAIALEKVYRSKSDAVTSLPIRCKFPFCIELFLNKRKPQNIELGVLYETPAIPAAFMPCICSDRSTPIFRLGSHGRPFIIKTVLL